jgi:hypothetical protein
MAFKLKVSNTSVCQLFKDISGEETVESTGRSDPTYCLRISTHVAGRIISHGTDLPYTSHSPDLTLPDAFLWGMLKESMFNCEDPPRTVLALREQITSFCWSVQHGWPSCPVDTNVYSPPMPLNNWQMDISLSLSFKAVHHRLHQGDCSTCWRTCVIPIYQKRYWSTRLPLPLTQYTTGTAKFHNDRQHNCVTWCCLIKTLSELFYYFFKLGSLSRSYLYEQK